MSSANHIFLSWVQPGAIANIPDQFVERLSDAQPAAVAVRVGVTINGRAVEKSVRLYGPGEVTGIDPQQVVRLEPQPRTSDFEPNYFPFIEFDRPDFPWLFSPAKADGQGRLRPWLVLVVVRRQPGVELRPAGDTPLPVLEIKAAGHTPRRVAGPVRVPFLGARADDGRGQNGASHGAPIGPGANDFTADLRAPAAAVDPVPRVRGSGVRESAVSRVWGNRRRTRRCEPSWFSGESGPAGHSAAGLLLVGVPDLRRRRVRGAGSPSRAARAAPGGRQASDGHQSSRLCASAAARDGSARNRHRTGRRAARRRHQIGRLDRCDPVPFQTALAPILNTPWKLATTTAGGDPIVAPPIYGAWHAGVHLVTPGGDAASPVPWINELNLDPRLRAAAAMGTEVVQAEQEALMASAWEQLGEAEAINQRLRQAQLSRAVNERYHTKAFARFKPDAFIRIVAPAKSRFKIAPAEAGGQGAMLFAQRLSRSFVPPAAVSPGVRKLPAPRGAFNRRYTRAGTSGTQALFTFFNQPGLAGAFVVTPGNRGYVGIDTVTDGTPGNDQPERDLIWVLEPSPHWQRIPVGFMEMTQTLRFQRLTPAGLAGAHWFGFGRLPRSGAGPRAIPRTALCHAGGVRYPRGLDTGGQRAGTGQPEAGHDSEPGRHERNPDGKPRRHHGRRARAGHGRAHVPAADVRRRCATDRQPTSFPDWSDVPPDTVQLLQTNNRFIESFMVGLNSEMGRELLWRGYPTDQRGTPFRQFWDATSSVREDPSDIPPIHEWRKRALGSNARSAGQDHLVLLLRGELLRRYPGS